MGTWRIDDLSRHTGVSVDTIRFYQREHLLPAPEREGRHKIYGDVHVARLGKIRELQARRFSLAAIRAFLDGERGDVVEGLFDDGGATYDLPTLIERSGIGSDLARGIIEAGLLREPGEVGRDDYDAADLDALRACRELADHGLPDSVIEALGGIYANGIAAVQARVVGLFTETEAWPEGDRDELQQQLADSAADLLPIVARIIGYVHHRTLQRFALAALTSDAEAATADPGTPPPSPTA